MRKSAVLLCLWFAFGTAPAVGEIVLWDTGAPHQVIFNNNTTYLGFTSGEISGGPQRWAAIPFRIEVPNAVITRLDVDFFIPTGQAPTTLYYIIWDDAGEDVPPTSQFTSGSLPIGTGVDDPRVPGTDSYLWQYNVNIPIPIGSYYLTIYGGPGLNNTIAWLTGGDLQAEDLEEDYMWRSMSFPSPGFIQYTTPAVQPVPGQDRQDIWNCSFTLYGVQNNPGACCVYVDGIGDCQYVTYQQCVALGGIFHPNQTCNSPFFCPPLKTQDVSPSQAIIDFEIYGQGSYTATFTSGCENTIVQRDAPPYPYPLDPNQAIDTELLSMNLTGASGAGPIRLVLSQSQASIGQVQNIVALPGGQNIASGDSFFDVFVELATPLGVLVNQSPIRVAASIVENSPGQGALPPDEHFIFTATGGGGCMGDVNNDGQVNGKDIAAFVACVFGGGSGCSRADMNCNGSVGAEDIPAFISALLAGSCGTPCPSGIELFPKAGGAAVGRITRAEHWLTSVPQSILGQPVLANYIARCDAAPGFTCMDEMLASGTITDLHWYGAILTSVGWAECNSENPMVFEIKFYHDNNGQPGMLACGPYTVSVTGLNVGNTWVGPLMYFSTDIVPACQFGYGWVSIQGVGTGSPDCHFGWFNGGNGNGQFFQNGALNTDGRDLNYCVTGQPEMFVGGCCVDAGGGNYTCEVVTIEVCYNLHGFFKGPNTDCSGPTPCAGACCYDAETPQGWIYRACEVTSQPLCMSNHPDGNPVFVGPGTTCAENPCPPLLGACCIPGPSCNWCQDIPADACQAAGGTSWTPDNCGQAGVCFPICGACCDTPTCQVVPETAGCEAWWRNAPCTPNPCSGTIGMDYCTSVVPMSLGIGSSVTVTGDTTNATLDCATLSSPEVWHAFTITDSCVNLTIDFCGSPTSFSTIYIVMFPNCPCVNGTQIGATNYGWEPCGSGTAPRLEWRNLPAGTYYYPVHASNNGPYSATVTVSSCAPPPICPTGSLYSAPVKVVDWTAGTSDTDAGTSGFLRYEKFTGVTSQISDLHFWGLSLFNNGSSWSECTENPMNFVVRFYADNAGQPGTLVATYSGLQLTGNVVYDIGYDVYEYCAVLSPPLDPVATGATWISIQGTGGTTCWFLWLSSATGDGSSCIFDGTNLTCGPPDNDYDLSFCLTGTGSCP